MLSIVKNIYVMTYQDYAMNDCYGLSVGRLTAWDRPMSVPVTCSHRGGRDKVGIRARLCLLVDFGAKCSLVGLQLLL